MDRQAEGHEQEAERTAARVMREPGTPHSAVRVAAARLHGAAPPPGSGQPLPGTVRAFFEERFGHDFSRVRVRTSPDAVSQYARAFVSGESIAFAPGAFAPETESGLHLLAHELTHVLQQRAGTPGPSQFQPEPDLASEARRFVTDQIDFLETVGRIYRGPNPSKTGPDELARQLQRWLDMLTKGREIVRINLSGETALTASLESAYASAVQALVDSAAQQMKRSVHDLFQEQRDRIDPVAYPKAAAEATAEELSSELTTEEQARLTLITTQVALPDLEDLFSTKGARTTIDLPDGVTARFASGIPSGLQHGLSNVAGQLIPQTLTLNSLITVALNLEPFGGDYAAYRFTYVERTRVNEKKKKEKYNEVLIEKLGAIGVEGLPPQQKTAATKKFNDHGFKRGSGWKDAEFENLLLAVAQISDSLLTPVDGITFRRDAADANDPSAGGDYDPDTHEITLYDRAFGSALTRFGMPGSGVSSDTVRSVIHEIGHAIDLLPLRQAWDAYQAGGGEQDLLAARSASGQRYIKPKTGPFTTEEGTTKADSIDFRKAALKDSSTRLTQYSNTEWQEYFAESFSIYIADPTLLKRLRPNVYAYFETNYPK